MRNKREQAVNPDLWGRLLDQCNKHEVEFRWVRGHAGDLENERCDQLAYLDGNRLEGCVPVSLRGQLSSTDIGVPFC